MIKKQNTVVIIFKSFILILLGIANILIFQYLIDIIKLFFKLSYQIFILLLYITLVIECNCDNQPADKSYLKSRNQKDVTNLPSVPGTSYSYSS